MKAPDRPIVFRDRIDAACQLARRLQAYRGRNPLVLAIPRGAVPMARSLAEALQGDLDVVLVRKLGAPFQSELAIGSVDESGWVYLAPHAAATGADQEYIAAEKRRQMDVIRQRRTQYTPVRQRHPARLVCAVPVSSPEALDMVRPLADEVLCLQAPADFRAVGQFYRDFAQVEDDEVVALLKP